MATLMTQAEAELEAQHREIVSANERLIRAVLARAEREKAMAEPLGRPDVAGKDMMGAFSGVSRALTGFASGLPMAAMGALESAMGGAAKAMNTWNDSSLSADQKMRKFGESLPVVGGLVASFNSLVDSMTGLEDQFRRDAVRRMMDSSRIPIEGGTQRQRMAQGVGLAGAAGYAGAMGGMPVQAAVGGDRDTVAGQRQYERERLLAPLRMQRDMAQAQIAGARAAETAAWVARSRTSMQLAGLRMERSGHEERLPSAADRTWGEWWRGQRGAISRVRTDIAGTDAGIQQGRQSLEAASNEYKARSLELAQRESEVRKANVAIARAELSLLEQKEQRLHAQLGLLGNMTRGQRNMAVRAAMRVDRVGWDQAGPAARQLAMQLNPDKAGILAKQAAEASGVLDRLPVGWRREGTRAGLDEEIRQADASVREATRIDAQKLAESVKKTMADFGDRMGVLFNTAVSDAMAAMENRIKIGNNLK